MIQTTTALRKISSLKKRIWGIQGGQGAGKTFAILILLINHASSTPNRKIIIASAELSKMRITVLKDFTTILKAFKLNRTVTITGASPIAKFPNGSEISFIGLDKEDIGKGLRSDIIFLNEANKTKFETYRELTSRAKRVIVDFNPNAKFWFHTEVQPREDCDFLVLTFKDNEFLSQQEINEILHYKKKGYDAEGNIINEYWANKWRIYGLGEIGGVEGRIFHWKSIPYNDFVKIDAPEYYSVDWGTVDPFAIGVEKYKDGRLYTHELNYMSENQWHSRLSATELMQIKGQDAEGFVTWLFKRLKIPKDANIICDSNRPEKVIALRNAGWDYALAIRKEKILEGIDLLQSLDVYYTDVSKNIEHEQSVYCWDEDRFGTKLEKAVDRDNHHIDRIKYNATWLRQEGIINRV